MKNKDTLHVKALLKLIDVYGMEYMKEKIRNTPVARSENGNSMDFYFLFENEDERPDLVPDHLGWTVYATVSVDMETGEATMVDYVLPDGTKMKK